VKNAAVRVVNSVDNSEKLRSDMNICGHSEWERLA
jgi:hypothetical protein